MSIKVQLRHRTHYRFDRRVQVSPHEIRLCPAMHTRTPISGYGLEVAPTPHFIHWQQDAFGNRVARVTFPEPVTEIDFRVELIADLTVINPFDFFIEEWATQYPFEYPSLLKEELLPFLRCEKGGEAFHSFMAEVRQEMAGIPSTTDLLVALNDLIRRRVRYMIRLEPGVQAIDQTLTLGSGSCRDSAWLLAQVLRHLGLASRFVSGYLIQLVPDVPPLEGPLGPASDFTDLHAWCEAYIPGAGWVGMDGTSGLLAGEGHIPLAVSSLPTSAAPVIGMTDPCESTLHFEMTVERIEEVPRVTKPYSEASWDAILALGDEIDEVLDAQKVRLTQGGEPTFVATDNMDAPEWNTLALGEEKSARALDLLSRLKAEFTEGAIVHFGQGKWYPGEALPRWSYNLFWREDGKPLWNDAALLKTPQEASSKSPDAGQFLKQLAIRLCLDPRYVIEAYEDPWHAVDAESRLPQNLDPLEDSLEDEGARRSLAGVLRRGLGVVAGYVLPIQPNPAHTGWQTSRWPLRQPRLYLLPGDSPLGLRLPLQSLPWVLPDENEPSFDRDPFEPLSPLTDPASESGAQGPSSDVEARKVVHTALAVEVRNQTLHVFLPPLTHLEDFVLLLKALEETAMLLKTAVCLEGYPPPKDARLCALSVTPDPGVIEVNIHPSSNWRTLVERTRLLYEMARKTRLGTEKFMLDGRHTGTGGGNHITLGGQTAADSPFLRRPDLLVSLVRYWQQHPGLSYLFSGQFIGPTSQAPRVDEARDDNLYELEIAFQQLDRQAPDQPWMIDRLLRNLLIDMTGNTHRAEFCIDKLYSPDTSTGRLGLVELRAFEMPPHYRMSLVQALLLRALIASFWRQPNRDPLVYWDTALHDRFLLPTFVERDLHAVLHDLKTWGFPFDPEWFAPFLAFRFPLCGRVALEGVDFTLRQAIEPWHVLGEEVSLGGTARYVDSSVERLEVRVRGLIPDRQVILCNNRRLPLHPTGTPGEYVAGVRFKAWAPPSALHPTIGVQAPLRFDLYDPAQGLSRGGCTYHVSHPGGRNYDTFPVNAAEAEARRRARFWPHGHTQGKRLVPDEPLNHRFPMTLDLRHSSPLPSKSRRQ